MKFDWDEKKNEQNYKKHQIWFEEAKSVWADSQAIEFFNPEHSESEERFIRCGFSAAGIILTIVFCERDNENTVRIISARKATSSERNRYEKRI